MFTMKRTFNKGRVLFALFSALLLLQRPVSQNTIKTSASAAYWQETTTIESGKKYIISIMSSVDGPYYLKPGEYTKSPNAFTLNVEQLTIADAWTFNFDSEEKITIISEDSFILYHDSSSTGIKSATTVRVAENVFGTWHYTGEKLLGGGGFYLTHYTNGTLNQWRPYVERDDTSGYTQTIKLYGLTYAGEANDFGTKFLSMTDGECNDKNVLRETWDELEEMYDNTSSAVKTLINSAIPNVNGSDLEHALVRYNHIVAAYGYTDFLNLTNNQAIKITNPPKNSVLPNVIMISTIGISVTLGYYFILKKTIKE